MGSWKYHIVHDYNATRLIKEFREENLILKHSKGIGDDEIDFIIYAEKEDLTISLGSVLLIKMSDAMVNYFYTNREKNDLAGLWAKHIYEQQKGKNTFHFTENELSKAFLASLKLQTPQITGLTVLEAENFLKKITNHISASLHEHLKFSKEQWDPTLKSDKYLFARPERAVNYFVSKSNSFIKELSQFKAHMELIKNFNIAGIDYKTLLIERLIKSIDNQIQSTQKFRDSLIEDRENVKLKIPYICGIWNGMIEFAAGIVEMILLLINIVFNALLDDSTNLELLEIREGIEEALEHILKKPLKVIKEISGAIQTYKYTRYDDPQLNKYQLQYNEGEDTILGIDLIATIITLIKGIAVLSKKLPKFTKWIDEVIARNGKGAKKLKNTLTENHIKLSEDLVQATKNKVLLQSSDKLDELYEAAKIADVELKKTTSDFALKTNGEAGFRDGLKSRERAIEKIESDYGGDVAKLVDIAGSKVVYETVDDLYSALNKFNSEYKILKIKDRIQKPLNGYRDILMNIEAKNGHIVEFRLHLKEIDDIADGIGHRLYEQVRSIKAKAISENRKLTIDEFNSINRLEKESLKLYNDAWIKIISK